MMRTGKQPPVFTQKTEPVKVEIGKSAKFHCTFTGDGPIEVTWVKDGQPIVPSFEFQVKTTTNSSTLEMTKTKPTHAGIYTARAENVAGIAESTANLLVTERADSSSPPNFTQVMSDMKISQGHPVRLDVSITGKPAPNVTWFKVHLYISIRQIFALILLSCFLLI